MAITYERVTTLDHEGRARTFLLRIVDDGKRFLSGIEVRLDGSEIAPPGHDQRLHVIDQAAVERRLPMRWNLHYGELEVDE
jgi:hypothetical protein